MKYERNIITMTFHWYRSQVSSLSNYVDDTPTETGLIGADSRTYQYYQSKTTNSYYGSLIHH